jgi:hypothetical protein
MIKLKRMKRARHVARMGKIRNECTVLVGKPEGKRPLNIVKYRWEDNIKVDLKGIGCDDVDSIHVAQDRITGRLM